MSSYDFQFYIKFPFVSVTVFMICPQLLNDPKRKLERFIESLFRVTHNFKANFSQYKAGNFV